MFSILHQNTALHIAAREGHMAAVKLLLNRGAELVLNKSDTSFLHEALQSGRTDVVNAVIDNEKWVVYFVSCFYEVGPPEWDIEYHLVVKI